MTTRVAQTQRIGWGTDDKSPLAAHIADSGKVGKVHWGRWMRRQFPKMRFLGSDNAPVIVRSGSRSKPVLTKLGLTITLLVVSGSISAQSIKSEVVRIESPVPELKLALHHEFKAQAGSARRSIVLFAEGSAVSTAANAAFKISGRSWMDDLAEHGFDVWSLDYLGYGDASRYPDAGNGGPYGRASDCAEQLAIAARYILRREKAEKLNVIGDSFGSLVAGLFATQKPELLDKLVLFAPVTPAVEPKSMPPSQIPNFDFVTANDFSELYWSWVPTGESTGVDHDFWLKEWEPVYLDTDPESRRRTPPSVKVPNGPDIDLAQVNAGQFTYDPAKIKAPTLVLFGEHDFIATEERGKRLFDLLTGTRRKSRVIVGKSTHLVQFESVRFEAYALVRAFLETE